METLYSNAQVIMHSKNEFYIDFYLLSADKPDVKTSEPVARIYMTPDQIMKLRDALEKNIGKFIEQYVKPKEKVEKEK